MQYLADTVAIIRHFASIGKIGRTAKSILQDADRGKNKILISIISMVEILYLSERNRIPLNLEEARRRFLRLDNYDIVDLDLGIVDSKNGSRIGTSRPTHCCNRPVFECANTDQ